MEFQKMLSLKEFAGTFASLVCKYRIGAFNMLYAGGVNLGMVLFVFGFPYINPYICTFMHFGPFWKWGDRYVVLISWIVAVCAEVGGACSAGTMHNHLKSLYGREELNNTATYTIDETAPAATCLADEMFAVAFLLVGTLHLMRALQEELLLNRSWNHGKLNPAPHKPLSIELIVCMVFLVISITHAFPSANQSLHVTIFLSVTNAQAADVCAYRCLGGLLGTMLALAYYHLYYNDQRWFTREDGYGQLDGSHHGDDVVMQPTPRDSNDVPATPSSSSTKPIPEEDEEAIHTGHVSSQFKNFKSLY